MSISNSKANLVIEFRNYPYIYCFQGLTLKTQFFKVIIRSIHKKKLFNNQFLNIRTIFKFYMSEEVRYNAPHSS